MIQLSNLVQEYKNKYDTIKKKSELTETVIGKVLTDSKADL